MPGRLRRTPAGTPAPPFRTAPPSCSRQPARSETLSTLVLVVGVSLLLAAGLIGLVGLRSKFATVPLLDSATVTGGPRRASPPDGGEVPAERLPLRRRFFGRLEAIVLGAASTLVFALVLGTPVTGLADQGDYQRLTEQLGIAPAAGQTYSAGYLTDLYRIGLTRAQLGLGPRMTNSPALFQYYGDNYRSSETILVKIALGLHGLLVGGPTFDIRWLGAVNAILLLAGLASLLAALHQLPGRARVVAVVLAGIAFSDVGYVLYLNSFFSEPAEMSFMLIAVGLLGCMGAARHPLLPYIGFAIASAGAVSAKTQDAIFCVPLALLGLVIGWRRLPAYPQRVAGVGLCAGVLGAGYVEYRSITPYFTQMNYYDAVFTGILPNVADKTAALRALGVSPKLANLAGYAVFNVHSAFGKAYIHTEFLDRIKESAILRYYTLHPGVLLSLLSANASTSLQLRVPFLGDYADHSYPAGAQYADDSPWTVVHRLLAVGQLPLVAIVLISALAVGVVFAWRGGRRKAPTGHLWVPEVLIGLPLMAGITYVETFVGGGTDGTIKHQLMFNVLFDVCLVTLVALAVELVARLAQPGCDSLWRRPACDRPEVAERS